MNINYLLGLDIGSSSVKAALIDAESGQTQFSAQSPDQEMSITARQPGWAEQDPESWWQHVCLALRKIQTAGGDLSRVAAIGISYQMHGLVLTDQSHQVIRDSIIWCDSRAISTGEEAFEKMGRETAMKSVLNSPGNFTAAKLAWVKKHEPDRYARARHMMLPGDFIALKLTGETSTTITGLSEGILWDFSRNRVSEEVLTALGLDNGLIPHIVPGLGLQGQVSARAAGETGLQAGTPVSYRAGDQPNNALSLNVFHPGELAATAGTSGVIYGILDQLQPDPLNRVNLFAHVNHTVSDPRLGVLLCINGTGIQYSWIRNQLLQGRMGYPDMNRLSEGVEPGADGLLLFPFGNGAERVLQNKRIGAGIRQLDLNRHQAAHLIRAAQEGIVFALNYGFEVMQGMGVQTKTVRAGSANLFLSREFSRIFATVTGTTVELYDTDGATGAARAAGVGAGVYPGIPEAFSTLTRLETIGQEAAWTQRYQDIYGNWKKELEKQLN